MMANSTDDRKLNDSQGVNDYLEAFYARMQAVPTMQVRFMREMLAFNSEALEFVQKRVQQDVETSGKLMSCKTPMEAAEVMRQCYDQACNDYNSQAKRMFEATRSVAQSLSEGSPLGMPGASVGQVSLNPTNASEAQPAKSDGGGETQQRPASGGKSQPDPSSKSQPSPSKET